MAVQTKAADEAIPHIEPVPDHVAMIMDGNGRWAKERGLPRRAGHQAGTENIRTVIERFAQHHVRCLTLFAFSTENWSRPRKEINDLMQILGRAIRRETQRLHEGGVRLRHIGRLDGLSRGLQRQVLEAIELTQDNTGMTVNVAFNYGGRAEIIDAVRRIVAEGTPPEGIDEALLSARLYTSGLPDPDLIIRTAGEMRLSNFLIWQGAYAEYYVAPVYWPDFDREEVDRALIAYSRRKRRFGGLLSDELDSQDKRRPY